MEQGCHPTGAAIPQELPGTSDSSNLWDVKMGQNNLCTGPATLCPKELFAKIQESRCYA